MKKTLMLSTLAVLASLFVMPTAANAAEARSAVNVRSGPGTSYRLVDRLFRGEDVNVRRCRSNGWCYITHPGPDGWVSARYLVSNGNVDDYLGSRRVRPNISFSIIIGGGGNDHDRPGDHGGPGPREELVCLVTFFDASDVEAGADADVESARVLPRSVAERLDRPGDRRGIFDYGSDQQTIETCDYLDNLN